MGRFIRLITWPLRFLWGAIVGSFAFVWGLSLVAKGLWGRGGLGGLSDEDVLEPQDWEDPEPKTTEPLSRSLDMLVESMDSIWVQPVKPFAQWVAERRIQREKQKQ